MPIRDIVIVQVSNNILMPIAEQLTNIVLVRLGCFGKFAGNLYVNTEFTKPSLTNNDNHQALISQDRADIKMSASLNPTEMKWDTMSFRYTQAYGVIGVHEKPYLPVFADPEIDVALVEQQLPCTMTLEFSLQYKNREDADMTISAINNTSLKDSVINYHDLSYTYPVDIDQLSCLWQIYQLRAASLGITFWDYLKTGTNHAVSWLKSPGTDKAELVIRRQAIQAYGVLEYTETAPQIEAEQISIDRFVVNFNYTLQFARPDVLRLYFPVVIANQLVPKWMLRIQQQNYLAQIYGVFQEMSITRWLRSTLSNIPVVARLPEYDDFRPPANGPALQAGFAEFFAAAVLLDTGSATTIDLLNIGSRIQLSATTIVLLQLHGQAIFDTTGLFNIAVYCNDLPVDTSLLRIDANLVVTLAMTNPLKRYHISLSEATDLSQLDPIWFDTLIAYRTYFPITIIRNLALLIKKGYCYIDHTNWVLKTVNFQILQGLIDGLIARLITAGHLTDYAYSFASTAEQFVDYLLEHHSPVSHRLVYDEYISLCEQLGVLIPAQLASGVVRTRPYRLPFLPAPIRGKIATFNTPLRVEWVALGVAATGRVTANQPASQPIPLQPTPLDPSFLTLDAGERLLLDGSIGWLGLD